MRKDTGDKIMIDTKSVVISLDTDLHAKLVFKQFQTNGDWICQMSDELMCDLEDRIENSMFDNGAVQ